jgi:hypothetical protein
MLCLGSPPGCCDPSVLSRFAHRGIVGLRHLDLAAESGRKYFELLSRAIL